MTQKEVNFIRITHGFKLSMPFYLMNSQEFTVAKIFVEISPSKVLHSFLILTSHCLETSCRFPRYLS